MSENWLFRNLIHRGQLFVSLMSYGLTSKAHPIFGILFITEKCNAKCLYCYVNDVNAPDDHSIDKRLMNGEDWKQLIDDLIDRGVRAFSLVGGEPMVSPWCEELINHLHKRGVFFNLTTNGSLVLKQIDLLKKVSQLTVSIDGDEQSNDRVRGKGWHKRAIDAIEAATSAGIPCRLSVVVTRYNRDQIQYIVDLCDRLNMYVTFTPCLDAPENRFETTRDLMLDDSELREFFKDLLRWKKKTKRIMNSEKSVHYMINYPGTFDRVVMADEPDAAYYPEKCPYGRFQYHFSEYGEVYPCAVWWNRPDFQAKTVYDGLDDALGNATEMPCQYCSFCNLVDWNEMTKPKALIKGALMTVRQYLGRHVSSRKMT